VNRVDKVTRIITAFMLDYDKGAGFKLELESDGSLSDPDSNWSFDPKALAAEIVAALEP